MFHKGNVLLKIYLRRNSDLIVISGNAAHLEHGCVFEHVWEDEEADLGAPDEYVFQLGGPAVSVGDVHLRHLAVHVVLGLHQLASVHLASGRLYRHCVALRFVQDLDRHPNGHGNY